MRDVARLRDRRLAVAGAWASVALPAALAAVPVAGLAATITGDRRDGDAALFAPGGATLLEALRVAQHDVVAIALTGPWLALVYSACAVVPWACLLIALASENRPPRGELAAAVMTRLPSLSFLFGAALAARMVLLAAGAVLVSSLGGLSANERSATLLSASGAVLAACLLAVVRVLHDLASAAVCRHDTRGTQAAVHAMATLARAPIALVGRWAALASLRFALVAAAAWATAHLGVATSGRLALVLLLHQATLVALVVLRAVWLRQAVIAVGGDDPAMSASRGEVVG